MSQIFTVTAENVSVSAAPQDILSVYAGSTPKMRIIGFEMSQNGQVTVGNYALSGRRLPATVTAGSGGSTPTPHNVNPSDSTSPPFTAHANDTTPATTSGTVDTVVATQFNPINGYYWQPPKDEAAPEILANEAFTWRLESITGTIHVSATVWIEIP